MLEVMRYGVEKYLEQEEVVYIQQYKQYGSWSAPKPMSSEKARHKLSVRVHGECPYRVVKVF